MKILCYKLFAGLCLVALMQAWSYADSTAGETITFTSYKIPLLTEAPEKGILVAIVREACKRLNLSPEITFYPPKRALKKFYRHEVQGLFPALEIPSHKEACLTIPIHYKRGFAFTLSEKTPPKSIAELKGKVVGVTRGYSYPNSILRNPNFKIDWGDSLPINLKKLAKGRVDCFISDPDSTIEAASYLNIDLNYDLKHPLFSAPAHIAFQHSQQGESNAKRFSTVIKEMEEDGTMQRLKKRIIDCN